MTHFNTLADEYAEALQAEAAANPPPLLRPRIALSAAFVAFVAGVVLGRAVEKETR